jgi:hypothetical protein
MTDRAGTDHPPLEELLAYRAGECGEDTANEIREHLVGCGECSRLLLDANGHADSHDPLLLRAWQDQRRRLRTTGAVPEWAVASHRPIRWSAMRLAAATAVAVLAALALSSTLGMRQARLAVAKLEDRLAELDRPKTQVVLVNLHTYGSFRSEPGSSGDSIPAPSAGDLVVLRLFLDELPPRRPLVLELVGTGGRDRTVIEGLAPQDPGVVIVGLLGDRLPPNTYTLELRGTGGAIYARYQLTVEEETR